MIDDDLTPPLIAHVITDLLAKYDADHVMRPVLLHILTVQFVFMEL